MLNASSALSKISLLQLKPCSHCLCVLINAMLIRWRWLLVWTRLTKLFAVDSFSTCKEIQLHFHSNEQKTILELFLYGHYRIITTVSFSTFTYISRRQICTDISGKTFITKFLFLMIPDNFQSDASWNAGWQKSLRFYLVFYPVLEITCFIS